MEELNNVDLSDIEFSVEAEDWIDVSALREMYHPFNSQVRDDHELTSIQRSIQKNGFTGTLIVVNKWNGKIVSGHGKVEACFKAGYRGKLPVVWREYKGEIEHRNAMLQFNMASGHQDPEKQRREIEALLAALPAEEVKSDLAITPDELQRILGMTVEVGSGEEETSPGSDTEPEIDKAEELRKKWNVETGQLWQLGKHRLICGDCTDRAVVDRVMKGEKATIVFTDPPYGVAIGAKNRMLNSFQKAGRNLTDIEDDALTPDELKSRLQPAFEIVKSFVMADDCTVFMTAPQGGALGMMMMMMMKDAGLPIRHVLIWKKNAPTFSMGRLDYDYQHEPILLTWGKRHKRPMLGQHKTSVWEINKPRASAEHPTMKPVELYENAYMNNSDNGDIAYEPYCGSGTAIIACENLNRQCRAVEISPAYCAVILERFFVHTGVEPRIVA